MDKMEKKLAVLVWLEEEEDDGEQKQGTVRVSLRNAH